MFDCVPVTILRELLKLIPIGVDRPIGFCDGPRVGGGDVAQQNRLPLVEVDRFDMLPC